MKKQTHNILVGSSIAALALATVSLVADEITKGVVRIAIDRNEPKVSSAAKSHIKRSPEITELRMKAAQQGKKLENNPSLETVGIISSKDSESLTGHLQKCEHSKRILIAMHGWRSSWSRDFGIFADFWHENDCTVLFAEQRGQGNSGGDYMGFGLLERYDCLDWVNWVNSNINKDKKLPVYLVGISMGASTVLMATGFELPDNVKGIIADCGYTSADAIWKHVTKDNLHMHYGFKSDMANEICKKKINIGAKEYSCTEALAKCAVPVLFVHGTEDKFVPVEMTYENYKACAAEKRLLIVPGAPHMLSYLTEKDNYEKAVRSLWHDCD